MMNSTFKGIGLIVVCFVVAVSSLGGAIQKKQPKHPRISVFEWKLLDGNRINCTVASDGPFADYRLTYNSGLEWPKGTGKTALFTAGIWLAGFHRPTGEIRVANMDYVTEYQAGPLLETFNTTTNDDSGPVSRADDPRYRLYKINKSDTVGGVNPDYDEWPGDLGAPFVDVNDNGIWDLGTDKPRFFGDQQIWVVFNDVNDSVHANLSTTHPLGVEIQTLYFVFDEPAPLGNTMFMRWRIINKSDADYDSVFIGQWTDVDMGDANDDLPGSDSLLSLGYTYNGDNDDGTGHGYGRRPPALGFVYLQGPAVPGELNDSVLVGGKWRKGFRALASTSFVSYDCGVIPGLVDPPDANPDYPLQAYDYLNGKAGATHEDIIDPITGKPMRFWFSGDPVKGTGNLPFNFPLGVFPPSDIRTMLNSGPFSLAAGDTQDVVAAFLMAQGKDRLDSVTRLKEDVRILHFIFGSDFVNLAPRLTHSVTRDLPPPDLTVELRLDEPNATAATALFVDPDHATVDSLELFDDGAHNDGDAGDGVFGNSWSTPTLPFGLSVALRISYTSGESFLWRDLITQLATAGPVTVSSVSVASDNLNSDGAVNPGENIRYVYGIENEGNLPLTGVSVKAVDVTDHRIALTPDQMYSIGELGAQSTASLIYDEGDPASYFSFSVREDVESGTEFSILMEILDDSNNEWVDTLQFLVEPLVFPPLSNSSTHTVGNSEGAFGVLIIDYPSLKDHTYEIRVVDSINVNGEVGFTLEDVTEGRIVLENQSLPDVYAHNIPVTDGFKVTKGTALYEEEYPGPLASDWNYSPVENRFITGKDTPDLMDTFFGGLAHPHSGVYIGEGTTVSPDSLKQVEIRFSEQNRQKAYRYLRRVDGFFALLDPSFEPYVLNRGGGYAYQDFVEVPFTVWEVDAFDGDATPRQLNVAFLENNDSLFSLTGQFLGRGKIDGQWYPTTGENGGREVVYVFASTYSDQEDAFYAGRNLLSDQEELDLLYVLWARLDEDLPPTFTEGDVFTIVPQYPPVRAGNVYTFNPVLLEVKQPPEVPVSFRLYQNFPNPFNPSTTIRYEVPMNSHVTLEIFDILGQKVATLVDEEKSAGRYEVRWDAAGFSSAVYFYRLRTGNFVETKKLVLVR